MAQSGHSAHHIECPLSGVKRTCRFAPHMSAYDPKRTFWSASLTCHYTSAFRQTTGNGGYPYHATIGSFQFWLGEIINDQLLRPAHTPPQKLSRLRCWPMTAAAARVSFTTCRHATCSSHWRLFFAQARCSIPLTTSRCDQRHRSR